MAILLIYRGPHWMSKLSVVDVTVWIEKDPTFLKRYDARYCPGDIIEVREDGAVVTNREKEKFTIVIILGRSKKGLIHLENRMGKEKVRRYRFDASKLPTPEREHFDKGEVELDTRKLIAAIVDKKNG